MEQNDNRLRIPILRALTRDPFTSYTDGLYSDCWYWPALRDLLWRCCRGSSKEFGICCCWVNFPLTWFGPSPGPGPRLPRAKLMGCPFSFGADQVFRLFFSGEDNKFSLGSTAVLIDSNPIPKLLSKSFEFPCSLFSYNIIAKDDVVSGYLAP